MLLTQCGHPNDFDNLMCSQMDRVKSRLTLVLYRMRVLGEE